MSEKKPRNVAVVHYNTPELTEAAIKSIKKHGGKDYKFFIFDNSDKRPFTKRIKNVKVFNNRQGQILDLDKELEKYPERDRDFGCALGCEFGSDKHMMSVQKLWELVPDGFLLIDSDILVKKDVDFMFDYEECSIGHIARCSGPAGIQRLMPLLLFINVPMCVAGGARFFDPDRSWALHDGPNNPKNFWDTGAAFLDDVKRLKPQCHGKRIDIRPLIEHYGSGSWHNNAIEGHLKWLEEHKDLWT